MTRTRLMAPMVICLAVVGVQAAIYWDKLPDRVATRFNGDGNASSVSTKETFFGFEMGLVFLTTGLFTLIASSIPKARPEVFNIPHREFWMAKERRESTVHFIQRRLWLMAMIAGAFTVLISQLVLDNSLAGQRMNTMNLLALSAVFAVLIAGFSISMAIYFNRVPKR